MLFQMGSSLQTALRGRLAVHGNRVDIVDADELREVIDTLVYNALFHENERLRYYLAWLLRRTAAGLAIYPASLHGLYRLAALGKTPAFTAPAFNLRLLSYDAARSCFRAMNESQAGAVIFDLASDELDGAIGPLEYATCVLGAAIREGYRGPVFMEGDAREQRASDESAHGDEIDRLKGLADELLADGYFNLEFDLSPVEDLTAGNPVLAEQVGTMDAAELASYVRRIEPPGVDTSIGVRLAQRGDAQDLILRLRAFLEGFATEFTTRAGRVAGIACADIEVAGGAGLEVAVEATQVARREFGVAGTVRYRNGAQIGPQLEHLPALDLSGVHLESRYEDLLLEHPAFPAEIRQAMAHWIDENLGSQRRAESAALFYQRMRWRALPAFRQQLWDMDGAVRERLSADLQTRLAEDFGRLRVNNTLRLAKDCAHMKDTDLPVPAEGYYQDAETTLKDLIAELG